MKILFNFILFYIFVCPVSAPSSKDAEVYSCLLQVKTSIKQCLLKPSHARLDRFFWCIVDIDHRVNNMHLNSDDFHKITILIWSKIFTNCENDEQKINKLIKYHKNDKEKINELIEYIKQHIQSDTTQYKEIEDIDIIKLIEYIKQHVQSDAAQEIEDVDISNLLKKYIKTSSQLEIKRIIDEIAKKQKKYNAEIEKLFKIIDLTIISNKILNPSLAGNSCKIILNKLEFINEINEKIENIFKKIAKYSYRKLHPKINFNLNMFHIKQYVKSIFEHRIRYQKDHNFINNISYKDTYLRSISSIQNIIELLQEILKYINPHEYYEEFNLLNQLKEISSYISNTDRQLTLLSKSIIESDIKDIHDDQEVYLLDNEILNQTQGQTILEYLSVMDKIFYNIKCCYDSLIESKITNTLKYKILSLNDIIINYTTDLKYTKFNLDLCLEHSYCETILSIKFKRIEKYKFNPNRDLPKPT